MGYVLLVSATLGVLVVGSIMLSLNPVPMAVAAMQSDESRLAAIAGSGSSSDGLHTLFQKVKLNNSDVKIIRQDVRRAMAAYPDIDEERLLTSRWFAFDKAARVPSKGFGNSHGTQNPITKEYYLESAYMSVVRPEYPNRADEATTEHILTELKDGKRQKRLSHIKRWGYSTSWGGTGGTGSINCYPDPLPSSEEEDDRHVAGQCVIILNGKTKYVFPFLATDWVDPPYTDLEKFAESKSAKPIAHVASAPKPWVIEDGLLSRGQIGALGRLYQSHFNWDKDDYDNEDIGPDTPESWVLERPFGLAYLPAPGNGERRSVPGKPWYVVASYYGFATQASGGWTEAEAKSALPNLVTSFSFGMQGQSVEELNRGNLREARCTQIPPNDVAMILADRTLPKQPITRSKNDGMTSYGRQFDGTLLPGESIGIGIGIGIGVNLR